MREGNERGGDGAPFVGLPSSVDGSTARERSDEEDSWDANA